MNVSCFFRKTIQTISLLAHLACDRGIWGPHLIVSRHGYIVDVWSFVSDISDYLDCSHQCPSELGDGIQEIPSGIQDSKLSRNDKTAEGTATGLE